MADNKNKKIAIEELCKNLKFINENQTIIVNNENDLLNYINRINEKSINLEKDFSNNKKIIEKEEQNIKKFIPLFDSSNNLFYETKSSIIKNTIEPPNEININNKYYNNIFILNKILEEENELCFEIKLGQGLWNNFINIKNKDIKNYKYNKMNSLKIGILKLNEEKIKDMSNYLTISSTKEVCSKFNWFSTNVNYNQKNYDEQCSQYNNFKNNILYSIDLTHLLITYEKKSNNNEERKRFIQKNDIIGIVINSKKHNDYIEVKIYINGILITSELINKECNSDNYSDIDDDCKAEQKRILNNDLVPFIELGINKSIFIKDKPSINNGNEIINSNEKMKYFKKYNCLSLNNFPSKTYEIQKITEYYLDILIKVGAKIFNLFPTEIDKYFKQLINFFNKYAFENRTILKYKIIDFLSKGINLENGNIMNFKEYIKAIFYIINKYNRNFDEKIILVKLIIDLLIELIMENNFELINYYNLNGDNKNIDNQLGYLRKIKYILFFLLFDNYIKEENTINTIFNQESFFKEEIDFMNFCFAIFNCCLYKDSINSLDYLKLFCNHENKFQKKKFLEFNFNKSLINNQNKESKLYYDIIQDYKFIIQNMKHNLVYQKNRQTYLFFKFITNFSKSEDNFSIINGIIIQLIKNYLKNNSNNLDKSKYDKIIYTNYINVSTKTFINNENEDTFFGKFNFSEINPRFNLSSMNIKDAEIKEALFFNLIVNCISNYYQNFLLKEENAKNVIECIEHKNNYLNVENNYEINKINYMIEFYQTIFSGKFYITLLEYANYLMEIINLCLKHNYFDILPYKPYLNNILFILDYLKLRCDFIDKNNLLVDTEAKFISSIIKNIFKYTAEFLGKLFTKVKKNKFTSNEKYEEVISIHINILFKVLHFDIGAIKHSLPEAKDNLILLFKNFLELYDNETYKNIYNNINSLIEFLYYFNEKKEHANIELKNLFFKNIMSEEIENFSNMKNESEEKKNNFINNTMYFNIFMIIYKRMKIIRDSLEEILKVKILFNKGIIYDKKYIFKFTQIMNILFNFLKENNMDIFYDTRSIAFLKINSFICKTFKIIYKDEILNKFSKIYKENNELIIDFFTQLFFLLSKLLLSKEDQFDYNYKIAKNRKGFHFEEFKKNFEKNFQFSDYKMMHDFLDILSNSFKKLCDDNDTLKEEDVDDNSIEIDQRDSCPICLDYTDKKDVHLKDCNHVYHLECLKEQISKNYTKCSLCKRPITGIKEDPNFKVNSSNNNEYSYSLFGDLSNNIFLQRDNHNSSSIGIFGREFFSNTDNMQRTLFSNNPINNEGGGLFGTNNSSNRNGGLFGTHNNSQESSLFGNRENSIFIFNNDNQGTGLFGNNTIASNLFGNNSPRTGLFGNDRNNNNQQGGLFGNNNNNNNNITTSLFGSINY